MKKSISTCLLILYSLSTSAQEVQVKIDQLIQGYVQSKDFNGTALIVKNNEVILKKGYGLRNLETLTKNDENGIYQVGSLTKQFTAALVMQLEQEGKLSIYEMIIKYFPDFPNGDKIKIQHLLNHTSGLYDFSDDPEIVKKDVTIPYQKKELLATFMKYPLKFDPGTKYKYSNIGYILLGYIIEKVSGKSFEQNVRERIFQPLGMTYSGFDFAGLQHQHKEKGYTSVKAVTPIASFIVDSTVSYASGSIFSTVDDLYKWERAIYTEKILSQSTWKAIFTPYKNKYGYGWGIDSLFNKEVMVHGGNIPGFSSYILRLPEDKSLIILLDNTSSAALPKIAKAIAAILYDKPYETFSTAKTNETVDLRKFVGEYMASPSLSITIALRGDQLQASPTGRGFYDIFYESDKVFKLKVIDAKIEFITDDTGTVTELVFHNGKQKTNGKKVR